MLLNSKSKDEIHKLKYQNLCPYLLLYGPTEIT